VVCIVDNVRFEDFCDSVRELFGADIRSHNIKNVFQKISTNPDAKYDWSEVCSINLFRVLNVLEILFNSVIIVLKTKNFHEVS